MRRVVVALATVLLAGCANPPSTTATPTTAPSPSASTSSPAAAPIPSPPAPLSTDLHAEFAAFSADIPAEVGLAVVSGPMVERFGTWMTGAAWSTIKVPLAIAALRAAPERAQDFLPAAISRSDNAAAEDLWALLGDPPQAAEAVQDVLRESGDESTIVQSERERAGFTAFGQTRWSTEAQARFAWRLPCIAGSDDVVADMLQIVGDQVWGLADDSEVPAKGGWGPGVDGGYLVRQLATITTSTGTVGVALAAEPTDGTFGSGVAAVSRLAAWVTEHRDAFATTSC